MTDALLQLSARKLVRAAAWLERHATGFADT
jgi:hypothetical protein